MGPDMQQSGTVSRMEHMAQQSHGIDWKGATLMDVKQQYVYDWLPLSCTLMSFTLPYIFFTQRFINNHFPPHMSLPPPT